MLIIFLPNCNTNYKKCILYLIQKQKEGLLMPEERNCGCGCNNGGLFGGCGGDCSILFFIIIFLLLFTNCGCGCGRGCGCN